MQHEMSILRDDYKSGRNGRTAGALLDAISTNVRRSSAARCVGWSLLLLVALVQPVNAQDVQLRPMMSCPCDQKPDKPSFKKRHPRWNRVLKIADKLACILSEVAQCKQGFHR